MFEEPEDSDEIDKDAPAEPADRAREKADYFRMHAELAAVFEGCRKFDSELQPGFDPELTRDIQRTIGRLEKSKTPESPILPEPSIADAEKLLDLPAARGVSNNDYHVYARPGESMVMRWLAGEQVESFYDRMQAHFNAGLNHYRQEERQASGWKQDPATQAYLDALDAIDLKMDDRYLRTYIRQHKLFVLSTHAADELDILFLADHLMGVDVVDLVGEASAPPDNPTDTDRAWFFKLFALRGMKDGQERMCFFTYLQKTEETFGDDW